MPDWSKTMQQTFEYYVVDPGTWKDMKRISNVESSSITRDSETDTLTSLSLKVNEPLGESYVRAYLVTIQNGIKEKHPLGTFLVQTPATSFDGKVQSVSVDAYSPLLELKENRPPIGYSILEGEDIMDRAYRIVRENVRAPIFEVEDDTKLFYDYVANTDDTWITFIRDLVANAKYTLDLDEMGRIIFSKEQSSSALQPVWTFDDSNSSILYPTLEIKQDLYGIPNAVEVIYSNNRDYFYKKVVNDDPNSPTSTVRRGREIVYRDINPGGIGNPTEEQLELYARRLLKDLSCLEYRITYKHGYCPVRVGDCVRLNYSRAGLTNVKAKIISQNIECIPGCPVTETAVFTNRLWGD
jgi:hypothetical protein